MKMKILCFIDNLGSGGAQRQMVNLAILFKERGHYVEFLTYYPDDFFLPILQNADIPVKCINEAHPIKRIYKVRRILRNGDQDVVLSFLDTPNFIACFSAIRKRNWKLVVGERSANIESFRNKKMRFMKGFFKYADYIVTNSYNSKEMWLNEFPELSKKLETIYNAIIINTDVNNIKYVPKKNGKLHVVVAASYRQIKNMDGVIKAVNFLSDDEKDKLIIDWYGRIEVSNDNNLGYVDAVNKINELNLNGIINLYPVTNNIWDKMWEADMVGLFSHYEGLPNSICEGMTLGKPIIMSRVSDYKQLIDENNGFLCDPSDPESIADVLRIAISTPVEKLLEMGKLSKQKASIMFNKERIVDSYLNLMELNKNKE